MIEVGTATLGIAAARTLRRKANTTKMTRTTAMTSVFCGVDERLPDGLRAIDRDREIDVARQRSGEPRQFRPARR